ncbi:hypothetical protein V2J52_13300 [Georgenia sp. MJ173]|uniref:hypothetical protein n=1 Tax=Georgenia sunbinii TaxID=3117728 RepID=UPI002F26BBE5
MGRKIVLTSTTGTQPLEFVAGDKRGEVYIRTEDGAGQVYSVAALARAVAHVALIAGDEED